MVPCFLPLPGVERLENRELMIDEPSTVARLCLIECLNEEGLIVSDTCEPTVAMPYVIAPKVIRRLCHSGPLEFLVTCRRDHAMSIDRIRCLRFPCHGLLLSPGCRRGMRLDLLRFRWPLDALCFCLANISQRRLKPRLARIFVAYGHNQFKVEQFCFRSRMRELRQFEEQFIKHFRLR